MGQERVEALFEGGEAFFASERFIEAVGCDDDVGFEVGEVLVEVAEVVGTRHQVHFVGRPGEVADREFVI